MTDHPYALISRRHLVGGLAATAASLIIPPTAAARPREQEQELLIRVNPTRVFRRTSDFNREGFEHAHCIIGVGSREHRAVTMERLVVTLLQGEEPRQSTEYGAAALATMNLSREPLPANATPPFRLFAMRLASTHSQAFSVDRIRCAFEGVVAGTARTRLRGSVDIPLETYTQATPLIFPFRGVGLITQGGVANDGHRNRSGMFAVDALALSDLYAVMGGSGDDPEDLAGWGRAIIAPAAGTIVVARGDRPDQPIVGDSNAAFYAPEFLAGGDPGNHVVIDQGSGEFSMIAHLRKDSLAVRVGERVAQGHVLGALGNSGDSSSPHVHHQLQTTADWMTADALPHHYENGPGRRHDRGWLFNAR